MSKLPAPGEGFATEQTIHATCLVIAESGILIRGEPGAGKSSLADALIAGMQHAGRFARLVSDDRTIIARHGAHLVARAHPSIAGLIERRGIGLVSVARLNKVVIGMVIDLVAGESERLPAEDARWTTLLGCRVPRLALPAKLMLDRQIQLSIANFDTLAQN